MKALILVFTLEAASLFSHAQGTINFANNRFTPVSIRLPDRTERLATAEDNLLLGAFFSVVFEGVDSMAPVAGLATIGPTNGVMIGASNILPIPGTNPGQLVFLQVRSWDAALGPDGWREARLNCAGRYYGETEIRQVTLGLTEGPAAIIWKTRTSSGGSPRFYPLEVTICPEPSTLFLGALGGLAWLILLRRRKGKRNHENPAPHLNP